MKPEVQAFFDPETFTVSYVVRDPAQAVCVVIDPVLDYDARTGRVGTRSAQLLVDYVESRKLRVEWILETHAHADHLSAAQWLKRQVGGKVAIGENIRAVQARFANLFGLGAEFSVDGSQFDQLLHEGDRLLAGSMTIAVWHTPGHTPACTSFLIEDCVFVGDTLFMPDYGTARADFPGGNPRQLFRSIQRILSLPPLTRLFMCHDYLPGGRRPEWETSVAAQRSHNPMVRDGITEADFVRDRQARDERLAPPALMIPSLQVNIRAGHLPEPEPNGVRYLKVPLNQLGRE